MTDAVQKRGAAPVGHLETLDAIEAASVIYLRLWSDGPDAQASVVQDFTQTLGIKAGCKAVEAFQDLCAICTQYARRPMMRHGVSCQCVGADECCFATFVATATDGDREDAMLIATLLVRPDVAPIAASLAAQFGLSLKRMQLRAPVDYKRAAPLPHGAVLH